MTFFGATPRGRRAALISAAFVAGCAAPVCAAAALPPLPSLSVAAATATAAFVVRRRHTRVALALTVLALIAAGLARGVSAADTGGPSHVSGHLGSGRVAVIAQVRSVRIGGTGVVVDAQRIDGADSDTLVSGGILVTSATLPPLQPGDEVEVDASNLRAPDRKPGPESEATLEREGVAAIAVGPLVSVIHHGGVSLAGLVTGVQQQLVHTVDAVLPEPAAPLVLGVVFGIHAPLAAGVRAPLQAAGLVHIVAVSGLKVVLVLGIVSALGRALHWPRRRVLLGSLGIGGAYVVLSGAGPAAVRSLVMAAVATAVTVDGRRADPVPVLATVAAAMLAADPPLVLDPGFQLSFLGTAGILALAEPMARRLPGPRLLVEPFAVTVAAQAATVPVMAGTFGVISVVGPVANALVLPLLPLMIVLGGAGAMLGSVAPALGWAPLQVAGFVANLCVLLAKALTRLPGSSIAVGTWPPAWSAAEALGLTAALVTYFAVRRRSRRLPGGAAHARGPGRQDRAGSSPSWRALTLAGGRGASRLYVAMSAVAAVAVAASAALVLSRPDGRLHVTVLSTGAATAAVVITGDGSAALIDGGASPALLQQALGRALPPLTRRLGLVVTTGGERAVVAGLGGLTAAYSVTDVVPGASSSAGAVAVLEALRASGSNVLDAAGRAWTWGGATWWCMPFTAAAGRQPMCALRVSEGGSTLLVLGDAGGGDQEELCAIYGGAMRADVIVSPPGGAISPVLLAVARPRLLVVPTAPGGRVAGAPPGVPVARTDTQGDVALSGGPDGLSETA